MYHSQSLFREVHNTIIYFVPPVFHFVQKELSSPLQSLITAHASFFFFFPPRITKFRSGSVACNRGFKFHWVVFNLYLFYRSSFFCECIFPIISAVIRISSNCDFLQYKTVHHKLILDISWQVYCVSRHST